MSKNDGHVIMKKSLAKALMEAGMQHFDGGGGVLGSIGNGVTGFAGDFTVQNHYNAQGPDMGTVTQNQDKLGSLLSSEAVGGGPNPAQIQLEQNANKIVQSQATTNAQNRALNPALAARMSGNQAVTAGQTAVANAGAQQAEQDLAAQGQLNQLYGQQQNASLGAEGINAQVAQNNANATENTQGGFLQSLPVIGGLFAKGGEVPGHMKKMAEIYYPKYAKGGSIQVPGVPNFSNANLLPDMKKTLPSTTATSTPSPFAATDANNFGASPLSLPELGSSEGVGGASAGEAALAMKSGGKVPGKAKVKGDSVKNDNVFALLSPGEDVLPRSVTQSSNPPQKAKEFVQALMDKKKKESDKQGGYSRVAKAKKTLKDRVEALEKRVGGAA